MNSMTALVRLLINSPVALTSTPQATEAGYINYCYSQQNLDKSESPVLETNVAVVLWC